MLRRLYNALRRRPDKADKAVVFVPSSSKLPALWPSGTGTPIRPDLTVLADASTDALTELCDDYWNSFDPNYEPELAGVRQMRDETVHRRALEMLAERGPEILEWARARLRHPDYFARTDAALLLGKLAERRQFGFRETAVAQDLAALATRPWEEDTKEVEANTVAVVALAKIGGAVCMATMRQILTSRYWNDDDLQYSAAEALAEAVDQPFMEVEDPVQAAKEWIRANP